MLGGGALLASNRVVRGGAFESQALNELLLSSDWKDAFRAGARREHIDIGEVRAPAMACRKVATERAFGVGGGCFKRLPPSFQLLGSPRASPAEAARWRRVSSVVL